MSRDQRLYQILVKFNSTRLNYSDLKTGNFGGVRHLAFDRKCEADLLIIQPPPGFFRVWRFGATYLSELGSDQH